MLAVVFSDLSEPNIFIDRLTDNASSETFESVSRDEPTISVLMGVYNADEYLEAAVESILNQTFTDFEFLIVDDASTDKSAEILSAYDDPRIRILQNKENKGLTPSLNRALEAARGTYIARQDADDLSDPDRFRRQIEYMDAHPEVAVLGTGAEIIDKFGGHLNRRRVLTSPTLADLRKKNHLIHGSILARRAALEDVGGYDELFRYSQDYDLWLRLAENKEIRNLTQPLYYLRVHNQSVYFAQKEESLLYAILARGRSTGEFPDELISDIRDGDISLLKEEFSQEQCREFHIELAKTYLRYGHTDGVRTECLKAKRIGDEISVENLFYALSFLPPSMLSWLQDSVRMALNTKIRVQNIFR